jgi:hypothetical protein
VGENMEDVSLILSIIASIGAIVSIIFNFKLNGKLEKITGNKNIQSKGKNSINNTGNNNKISK